MSTNQPDAPKWAVAAAKGLYPGGIFHYCYDSEEKNTASRNRDWNGIAAIIAQHADAEIARSKTTIQEYMDALEKEETTSATLRASLATAEKERNAYAASAESWKEGHDSIVASLATATRERDESRLALGHLHGRVGLFAAKWWLLDDNLPTDETFKQIEDHIIDYANKYMVLMGERDNAVTDLAALRRSNAALVEALEAIRANPNGYSYSITELARCQKLAAEALRSHAHPAPNQPAQGEDV